MGQSGRNECWNNIIHGSMWVNTQYLRIFTHIYDILHIIMIFYAYLWYFTHILRYFTNIRKYLRYFTRYLRDLRIFTDIYGYLRDLRIFTMFTVYVYECLSKYENPNGHVNIQMFIQIWKNILSKWKSYHFF